MAQCYLEGELVSDVACWAIDVGRTKLRTCVHDAIEEHLLKLLLSQGPPSFHFVRMRRDFRSWTKGLPILVKLIHQPIFVLSLTVAIPHLWQWPRPRCSDCSLWRGTVARARVGARRCIGMILDVHPQHREVMIIRAQVLAHPALSALSVIIGKVADLKPRTVWVIGFGS